MIVVARLWLTRAGHDPAMIRIVVAHRRIWHRLGPMSPRPDYLMIES